MTSGYRPDVDNVLDARQVLNDARDMTDDMTAEQAVEYRLAAEKVKKAAQEVIDFCNQRLIHILDGQPAIIREGRKFYVGRKAKRERYDHDAIASQVATAVLVADGLIDESTGEIVDLRFGKIAIDVAHAMKDVYTSDSTKVKVTQLDRFGINRDENKPNSVREVLRGAKQVHDIPAGGET
jgi:hypothetical protein